MRLLLTGAALCLAVLSAAAPADPDKELVLLEIETQARQPHKRQTPESEYARQVGNYKYLYSVLPPSFT